MDQFPSSICDSLLPVLLMAFLKTSHPQAYMWLTSGNDAIVMSDRILHNNCLDQSVLICLLYIINKQLCVFITKIPVSHYVSQTYTNAYGHVHTHACSCTQLHSLLL